MLIAAGVPQATADTVTITDGSRIVGTIERWSNGTLVIRTDFAGRLEIDTAKVAAIATDSPVNAEFVSGDRLVGPIQEGAAGGEAVMETALGDIPVATADIAAVWPVGAESPEVVAAKKKAEEARKALKPKWTLRLEGGATRREGNTDTLEGRARFDLKRQTNRDLLEFYAAAIFAEQNDQRTENEYRGGVRYEAKFNDLWYWYTRMGLEFDEFENLDLRATASVGAGYYWLKKPSHELKTSVGAGYRHEAFDDGSTEDQAVLDLGLDYRYDIAPWVQLTHQTIYSPAFEDIADFRLDVDTALVFPLKYENWKLKLGMTNQYNARPQPGIDRLDNTYYANVLLELK